MDTMRNRYSKMLVNYNHQELIDVLCRLDGASNEECMDVLNKTVLALVKQNIGETVVQVPYLIDGETGMISDEFIDEIAGLIE